MNFKAINEEVLYTMDAFTNVNGGDIELLKAKASKNPRKRIRFCAHKDTNDTLHEMIIVHSKGAYVRPHKHVNKSESFHMIEGKIKIVIFENDGEIKETILLGDPSSGEVFFFRISESFFHTVISLSETVVFHETTNGPFIKEDTIFAEWAPPEEDSEGQSLFLKNLEDKPEFFSQNTI